MIIVKEDRKQYLKSNEIIPYCALLFSFKDKESQKVSRYRYNFLLPVSTNEINGFICQFLENPTLRNEHLIEGQACSEVFPISINGIHIHCHQQIAMLNQKDVVSDEELAWLRTQGMDKYSNMKLEDMEELIDGQVMSLIRNKFFTTSKVIKVCRWYLRGLSLSLAMQKVEADEKIIRSTKKEKNVILG